MPSEARRCEEGCRKSQGTCKHRSQFTERQLDRGTGCIGMLLGVVVVDRKASRQETKSKQESEGRLRVDEGDVEWFGEWVRRIWEDRFWWLSESAACLLAKSGWWR
jgi:hypothetical protein